MCTNCQCQTQQLDLDLEEILALYTAITLAMVDSADDHETLTKLEVIMKKIITQAVSNQREKINAAGNDDDPFITMLDELAKTLHVGDRDD